MNCPRIHELLTTSLDESLAPAERAEVEVHLAACPPCVGWMKEQVLTVHILRGLGAIEAAERVPPLPEHLIERIMGRRKAAATTAANEGRRTG